jgi:hypothetical protein
VRRDLGIAAIVALLSAGCVGEPDPGEFGTFRYVGNVRGATPLNMIPPISDRDGNAYVLYGSPVLLEFGMRIGNARGGWTCCGDTDPSGLCTASVAASVFGGAGVTYGIHGFVGRSQSKAWFWSGEALVAGNGKFGGCNRILEQDPSSNSNLAFLAVIPWVRETPSRLSTLAYIQAPSDPRPFSAVIDLERDVYTNLQEFEPSNATDVQVLGVGGNLSDAEGVVVVRYTAAGTVRHQARFMDVDATEVESVKLSGLDTLPPYGIVGYIHSDADGLYAGLDVEGQVLVFDKSGGKRRSVSGMTPVGVHEWEGKLYVVGEQGGKPRIASIDASGSIGDARTWAASEAAEDNLGSEIEVVDDRTLPSRLTTWDNPSTAMGNHIFVHPHRLDHYANGTTSWLIAGPSLSVAGNDSTAVGYVPVGISYEE